MRAADIVRRIWGDSPLATPATPATSATPPHSSPGLSQLSQLSQGVAQGNCCPPVATVATVANVATVAEGRARELLPDLLAQHGGFPGIDWQRLALIDATTSALWIVQRPDGLLTVLATVDPIRKPLSYRQAWPAKFTGPEPADDAAPAAAQAAQTAIEKARQSCWDCRHLDTHPRPTCALRHPVAWRLRHASTGRQTPSRTDQLDCGDHTA